MRRTFWRRFAAGPALAVVAWAGAAVGGEIPNGVEAFASPPTASQKAKAAAEAKAAALLTLPNGPAAFAPRVVAPIGVDELTAAIDRLIAAKWAAMGVTPAPAADDAEFLRRVCPDVA